MNTLRRLPGWFKAAYDVARTPPWSYLSIFIGTGIILWLLIGLPYALARRTASNQARSIQAASQQASTWSSSLITTGLLGRVQLGQIGPANTFATGLMDTTSNFSPVELSAPLPVLPPLLLPSAYPSKLVTRVNQAGSNSKALRNQTAADLAAAKHLLSLHARVTSALVNILSYNPSTDFATYKAGSADTKHRLDLAASGLSVTHDKLIGLKSSEDPTLSAVIAQIDQLDTYRRRLANDGNVADWVAAVQLAQIAIVDNRDKYWMTAAGPLAVKLGLDADRLNSTTDDWIALSAGKL